MSLESSVELFKLSHNISVCRFIEFCLFCIEVTINMPYLSAFI